MPQKSATALRSFLTGKSAKREAKNLNVRIQKFNFKLAIDDWSRLPDQLVQALPGHRAEALIVNIYSVCRAGRLSIDQHAKFHGRPWRRGTHDEMKVARVKAIRDATVRLIHFDGVALYRPIPGHRPIVQAQLRGHLIHLGLVADRAVR